MYQEKGKECDQKMEYECTYYVVSFNEERLKEDKSVALNVQ